MLWKLLTVEFPSASFFFKKEFMTHAHRREATVVSLLVSTEVLCHRQAERNRETGETHTHKASEREERLKKKGKRERDLLKVYCYKKLFQSRVYKSTQVHFTT